MVIEGLSERWCRKNCDHNRNERYPTGETIDDDHKTVVIVNDGRGPTRRSIPISRNWSRRLEASEVDTVGLAWMSLVMTSGASLDKIRDETLLLMDKSQLPKPKNCMDQKSAHVVHLHSTTLQYCCISKEFNRAGPFFGRLRISASSCVYIFYAGTQINVSIFRPLVGTCKCR